MMRSNISPNKGKKWSFEEFCVVYCNTSKSPQELAKRLGRSEKAIDTVRALIDAVHSGTAAESGIGKKWRHYVNLADSGKYRFRDKEVEKSMIRDHQGAGPQGLKPYKL